MPANEGATNPDLEEYFRAVELLEDTSMGLGALKALRSTVRQKGVDVQLACDMLTGAYTDLFDVAVLVAGDADFVPVVAETKRRGVMVVVAAEAKSIAEELRRIADRFITINETESWLKPLQLSEGRTIPAR